jgi:transcriptional regulator with XRE-family HTH domain
MNLTQKIGLNIRKVRIAKQLSQEQLAYLTSLHQSQIYRFEKGKQPMNTLHLEKISNVLEIPVIELFKTDIEIQEGVDNQEILEIVYKMPEDKRVEFLKILRKIKNFNFSSLRKALELVQDIKGD